MDTCKWIIRGSDNKLIGYGILNRDTMTINQIPCNVLREQMIKGYKLDNLTLYKKYFIVARRNKDIMIDNSLFQYIINLFSHVDSIYIKRTKRFKVGLEHIEIAPNIYGQLKGNKLYITSSSEIIVRALSNIKLNTLSLSGVIVDNLDMPLLYYSDINDVYINNLDISRCDNIKSLISYLKANKLCINHLKSKGKTVITSLVSSSAIDLIIYNDINFKSLQNKVVEFTKDVNVNTIIVNELDISSLRCSNLSKSIQSLVSCKDLYASNVRTYDNSTFYDMINSYKNFRGAYDVYIGD